MWERTDTENEYQQRDSSVCCRNSCGDLAMDGGRISPFSPYGRPFSRYIQVQPLKDQEASSLIKAFEQGWIYKGHGVPFRILSDQGSSIDGEKFRKSCRSLGVEKKRTTPYHPETDWMADRNIGMVKQVIRCLQMDRNLPKDSWPSLLTEVSFHCNAMNNATTGISPHMLAYGQQPRSPMDI